MRELKSIDPSEITDNPFRLIGKDWMLITAGDLNKYNTMTASWGALGVLWNKNTSTIYVRPTRYTYEFLEKIDYYTLSFFSEEYRPALNFCGANSGKTLNKAKETVLTPVQGEYGVFFRQSRLVLECKKIFYTDLAPGNFLDKTADATYYPKKDYHRIYIGEILSCLVKE